MTAIQFRPVLATALAFIAIALAIAIAATSTDAAAKSARHTQVGNQIGGAISQCSTKRIFFENCYWRQLTCRGQVVSFTKLSCPGLR